MHTSGVLVGAATLYGLTSATPVDVSSKKTFTVDQILNTNRTAIAPAQRLLNVYLKYASVGATVPTAVKIAAASATQGSVSATPEAGDEEYLSPVTVGGKTLQLNFDTGSADLWVFSTLQPSAQQKGHAVYNPKTGKKKSGYTWDIAYGDGSGAGGVVYADKVVVGGVTATSQAVEAATSVSSAFLDDTANDGIMGLAFSSSINTVQPNYQNTFFDTVKSQLASPLFTANLKKGAAGSYDFGYINSSKHTGSIYYAKVATGSGYWTFNVTGYAVGTGSKVSESFSCIADTGTSLALLPDTIISAYYKKVKGSIYSDYQGGWIFPCGSTLPSFSAIIGGGRITVPGSYVKYADLGSDLCYGGIQSDEGIGFSILGDVFLKAAFVVFSEVGGVAKVGFANKKT